MERAYSISFNADGHFTVEGKQFSLSEIYGLCQDTIVESYVEGDEFSIEGFVQEGKVQFWEVTKKY